MFDARSDVRDKIDCRAEAVDSGGELASIWTIDFKIRTASVTVDSGTRDGITSDKGVM